MRLNAACAENSLISFFSFRSKRNSLGLKFGINGAWNMICLINNIINRQWCFAWNLPVGFVLLQPTAYKFKIICVTELTMQLIIRMEENSKQNLSTWLDLGLASFCRSWLSGRFQWNDFRSIFRQQLWPFLVNLKYYWQCPCQSSLSQNFGINLNATDFISNTSKKIHCMSQPSVKSFWNS